MGVVFLLISSGIIIILVAAGLIFSLVILPIYCCHLRGQPPILILELSDYPMQSFYSRRARDVVHLILVMLLMLVVMLIVLITQVVTNIISHVHTLTP